MRKGYSRSKMCSPSRVAFKLELIGLLLEHDLVGVLSSSVEDDLNGVLEVDLNFVLLEILAWRHLESFFSAFALTARDEERFHST